MKSAPLVALAAFVFSFTSTAQILPDTVKATLTFPNVVEFHRLYGGTGIDVLSDIKSLPDGGFVAVGYSASKNFDINVSGSAEDAYVGRFDKFGRLLWQQTFGGGVGDDFATVAVNSAGEIFAAGAVDDNARIVKLSPSGSVIWSKSYGGSSFEKVNTILLTSDGGLIFSGSTRSSDGDIVGYVAPSQSSIQDNAWIVKLDANGNISWQKCYTDGQHGFYGNAITREASGTYIVAGPLFTGRAFNQDEQNAYFIRIDPATQVVTPLLTYSYGNFEVQANSLVTNADGTITAAGYAGIKSGQDADTSNIGLHGAQDLWMIKLRPTGQVIWSRYFGGSANEFGSRIRVDQDGNYIVSGDAESTDGNVTNHRGAAGVKDAWLIKVDTSGRLLWQKTFGGSSSDRFNSVTVLDDGDIIAVGDSYSSDAETVLASRGSADMFLLKIGQSNYINGKAFVDFNNNLIQDAGEPLAKRGFVSSLSATSSASTVLVGGTYNNAVDTGNFVTTLITPDTAYYNVLTVGSNASSLPFTPLYDTVDFALQKKADIRDLRITVSGLTRLRPGTPADYLIKYENYGTVDVPGTRVQFVMDPRTSYFTSDVPFSAKRGDTLEWNTGTLAVFSEGVIRLTLQMFPSPILNDGDTVRSTSFVYPISGDATPANNRTYLPQLVSTTPPTTNKEELHGKSYSYDPVTANEYLNYVIRFQNTGGTTAANVYVRDTLSDKIDLTTVEMLASSHPYQLSVTEGNQLEWFFNHINLPTSSLNDAASRGYIAFRARAKKNLSTGDSVHNRASVYFDFAPDIVTNRVSTELISLFSLPSTLLLFKGELRSPSEALLTWNVTDEHQVAFYELQHSVDGSRYTPVAKVAALNNAKDQKYSTVHQGISVVNYYRLRTVDIDGKEKYSKVVRLSTRPGELTISFYPNPVSSLLTVQLDRQVTGNVQLRLVDLSGKTIYSGTKTLMNSSSFLAPFNFSRLPSGTYLLTCKMGETVLTEKIVK